MDYRLLKLKNKISKIGDKYLYTKRVYHFKKLITDDFGKFIFDFSVYKGYTLKGTYYYIDCGNLHTQGFRSKEQVFKFWLENFIKENPLYERLKEHNLDREEN